MKPFIIAAVLGGIIGALVWAAAGPSWGILAASVTGGLSATLASREDL